MYERKSKEYLYFFMLIVEMQKIFVKYYLFIYDSIIILIDKIDEFFFKVM